MPSRLTGVSKPMGYEALRSRDSAQRQLELCKADAARKRNLLRHNTGGIVIWGTVLN